jgi:pimeloyl-ACP methyl ester carboxylesterase
MNRHDLRQIALGALRLGKRRAARPLPPVTSDMNLRLVHEDAEVQITHLAGASGAAVISFTGIGFALGGIQVQEFRKSLAGLDHDLWFVIDKRRHWYNEAHQTITDILDRELRRREIRSVTTLGNSMGGFGAVLFAGRLHNCRHAIAFSPQSAVDPAITPWETRWRRLTASVERWQGLDAAKAMTPRVGYALFFGADDGTDLRHARRFANAAPESTRIYTIANTGHDLVEFLKQAGVLAPLIKELTADCGETGHIDDIMTGVPYALLT